MLTALGLRVPEAWLIAVPKLLPEWSWLQHAVPGKPVQYAYCFCRLQ
jgi:hypothetical protein